jgi:hypothetical protein
MYLNQEIKELKAFLKQEDKQVNAVSEKGIHWHIDHSLRVISGICSKLKHSDPNAYKPKFNVLKLGIMTTAIIPRGKAKAPKKVLPPEDFDSTEIQELFSKVEHQLKSIEKLDKNHFYSHHIFGDLNLKKSVKFMGIHTHHHLKIMEDIRKKNS